MEPSIIQPGDVLLFQGKTFLSRGIMWFTSSKYSHSAVAVSGTYAIEATRAGVEKNPIDVLLTHADAYCIRRMPDLTVEQSELIKDKAYSLIYDDYDVIQLLTLGIYYAFRKIGITWAGLVLNMPHQMTCSELVAVCFLCVPLKFRNKAKLVTPGDLYSTDELATILEAKVE